MIPHGVEVFIGIDPIDLRWGFDRLKGTVQERMGRNPKCGALFVFFGKRKTAIKVFFCDNNGACIFYKRLEAGTFKIPLRPNDTTVLIDERALDALLDGIDATLRSRPTH